MKKIGLIGLIIVLSLLAYILLRQEEPDRQRATSLDAVVIVEGKPISKQDYEKEQSLWQHFEGWAKANGEKITDEKDPLEDMIDAALIEQYAQSRAIVVGSEELEARYQQAVASVGTEAQYLAKIKAIRNFDREQVREKLRMEILAEKVEKEVGMPLTTWLSQVKQSAKIERKKS